MPCFDARLRWGERVNALGEPMNAFGPGTPHRIVTGMRRRTVLALWTSTPSYETTTARMPFNATSITPIQTTRNLPYRMICRRDCNRRIRLAAPSTSARTSAWSLNLLITSFQCAARGQRAARASRRASCRDRRSILKERTATGVTPASADERGAKRRVWNGRVPAPLKS